MKIAIDTHTHTVHSTHAYSTINENMLHAAKNNLELICMTDHAFNLPAGAHLFHFANLKTLPSEMYGVKLLKGAELNILDDAGTLDSFSYVEGLFDSLEFKIASLHPPVIDPKKYPDFTKTVINTLKNNNVQCLGHIHDPRYPMDIEEIVRCAADRNILIEMNNSSLVPLNDRFDVSLALNLIECCIKHDAKITFGSDAHFFTHIGDFSNIHKIFEDYKVPYDNVITTDVNKFLEFVKLNRGK